MLGKGGGPGGAQLPPRPPPRPVATRKHADVFVARARPIAGRGANARRDDAFGIGPRDGPSLPGGVARTRNSPPAVTAVPAWLPMLPMRLRRSRYFRRFLLCILLHVMLTTHARSESTSRSRAAEKGSRVRSEERGRGLPATLRPGPTRHQKLRCRHGCCCCCCCSSSCRQRRRRWPRRTLDVGARRSAVPRGAAAATAAAMVAPPAALPLPLLLRRRLTLSLSVLLFLSLHPRAVLPNVVTVAARTPPLFRKRLCPSSPSPSHLSMAGERRPSRPQGSMAGATSQRYQRNRVRAFASAACLAHRLPVRRQAERGATAKPRAAPRVTQAKRNDGEGVASRSVGAADGATGRSLYGACTIYWPDIKRGGEAQRGTRGGPVRGRRAGRQDPPALGSTPRSCLTAPRAPLITQASRMRAH
eukprot:349850-Chlamydomonas_euryale.AAC.14